MKASSTTRNIEALAMVTLRLMASNLTIEVP